MNKRKHYLGIKVIEAFEQEKDGKPGYTVIYPDGYVSWSPLRAFQDAYICLGDDPTKITPQTVEDIIAREYGQRLGPKTTLVECHCVTGFVQFETSSCVDPNNYDHQLGKKIGMAKIKNELWFALGFALQWARFGLNYVGKEPRAVGPQVGGGDLCGSDRLAGPSAAFSHGLEKIIPERERTAC